MASTLYPPLNDPPLEGDVLVPDGARGKPKRPLFTKTWQQFFSLLNQAAGGGIAPASAEFVLTAPNGNLPAAGVLVSTDTVTVDTNTPGQVKLHATAVPFWYVPLSNGAEPMSFISNGAGSPILVAYTP